MLQCPRGTACHPNPNRKACRAAGTSGANSTYPRQAIARDDLTSRNRRLARAPTQGFAGIGNTCPSRVGVLDKPTRRVRGGLMRSPPSTWELSPLPSHAQETGNHRARFLPSSPLTARAKRGWRSRSLFLRASPQPSTRYLGRCLWLRLGRRPLFGSRQSLSILCLCRLPAPTASRWCPERVERSEATFVQIVADRTHSAEPP